MIVRTHRVDELVVLRTSHDGEVMIRRQPQSGSAADGRAPTRLKGAAPASAAALLIGAAAVSPATAQTAAAPPTPTSPPYAEPVTLEEIIVTGTKRAENVQSVPASVFVATAASMERA